LIAKIKYRKKIKIKFQYLLIYNLKITNYDIINMNIKEITSKLEENINKYASLDTTFEFIYGKNEKNFNYNLDEETTNKFNEFMASKCEWIEVKRELYYKYVYGEKNIYIYEDGDKITEMYKQYKSILLNLGDGLYIKNHIYNTIKSELIFDLSNSTSKGDLYKKLDYVPSTNKYQQQMRVIAMKYMIRDSLIVLIEEMIPINENNELILEDKIYKISFKLEINKSYIDSDISSDNTYINIPKASQIINYIIYFHNILNSIINNQDISEVGTNILEFKPILNEFKIENEIEFKQYLGNFESIYFSPELFPNIERNNDNKKVQNVYNMYRKKNINKINVNNPQNNKIKELSKKYNIN